MANDQISKQLNGQDIARAALALGVTPAHVRAVAAVESKGAGFRADGLPVILFERHKMYRALVVKLGEQQANALAAKHSDIVSLVSGGYGPESTQHDRMGRAAAIDRTAALESASWGMFQIMGFHWRTLGYGSLQDFVNAMSRSEGDQLDAFVRFVRADPRLVRALQTADWATFARLYNGPDYAKNQYDVKLAKAFADAQKAGA